MTQGAEPGASPSSPGFLTGRPVARLQAWATRWRFLLALPAVAVLVAFTDRGPMWPGVAIALAGELTQLWASAHLHKNVDLVLSGPYALVRNPMYVGRFLVGLGLVLLTWRWFLILPYAAGFWLYAQARVLGEEAHLRQRFGDAYAQYCRAVRRWLPLPPRQRFSDARWSWEAVRRNHQHRVTAAVLVGLALLKWRLEALGPIWPVQ